MSLEKEMHEHDDQRLLRMPLRETPWPAGGGGNIKCPVCGNKWRPWAGSLLPCHARCLLTDAGAELCHSVWNTTKPFKDIAEILGVPPSVVKSTLQDRYGFRCAGSA